MQQCKLSKLCRSIFAGIIIQTWRPIGWYLIFMNDNRKSIVEVMNYLILNHIPLVILRALSDKLDG